MASSGSQSPPPPSADDDDGGGPSGSSLSLKRSLPSSSESSSQESALQDSSQPSQNMLGRDAAAIAGRLSAVEPAFNWAPLANFMAASAPDEREAAATNEPARAFAVPEEQEAEEEARAAAAPAAVRRQDEALGSSGAAPIELDGEEDAPPGGTAPLPPAPAGPPAFCSKPGRFNATSTCLL